jgi:hypothetical protein
MIHRLYVHLADSERGNCTMHSVACLTAADHLERPLLVTVCEQAGWWLSFLFDDANGGVVVGSANDAAVFDGDAAAARARYSGTHFVELGTSRRPAA